MPSDDILAIRRRKLLEDAGRETQGLFDAKGHRVSFSGGSRALDAAVRDYRNMREEYAQKHGIAGGLLANHKVAALLVMCLIDRPPTDLFVFEGNASVALRKSVMGTFLLFVINGVLLVDKHGVLPTELQEDLEYCLAKAPPTNVEWMCFTMHTLCRLAGAATNIQA